MLGRMMTTGRSPLCCPSNISPIALVLAATQMPEEPAGWFQGTADAIRKFIWVLEDYYNQLEIEHILILCGDQIYRMNFMELVQKHVDDNADISISCAPADESRASDYGLVKFDSSGRVIQFLEKPMGADLEAMKVDTSFLSYAIGNTQRYPYIASMGVYVFKRDILLDLLKSKYTQLHDFGSEILPRAVLEHNVQACIFTDYWEDIGTIKSFFDANLALTEQPPKFEFYDPKTPIFTSPRYLPPTRLEKCKDFLENTAYPLLEGCATFLVDWLIEGPAGCLETNPSTSPEHAFVAPGAGNIQVFEF